MAMVTVRDGSRILKFSGRKISRSSSFDEGKHRWIEFDLFVTDSGTYVLARIGASRLVHLVRCSTVERNRIKEVPVGDVEMENGVICSECRSTPGSNLSTVVYPEVPRYWASVTDSAESVVESLYKVDYNGSKYMTDVARRLLETAVDYDQGIADAYLTEYIE